MISTRLQQTLNSRIELIENLLLIYSYAELVNLRVEQYRKQNQKIHQKEVLLLQTYQNIFKMDENFRKQTAIYSRLFYNLVVKVFRRLNGKYKPAPKQFISRINAVYLEFLVFFKIANELQIIRYLQRLDVNTLSENQLFVIMTSTLIRYMKGKTDAIIVKLKQKCKKEDIDFYEEKTIRTFDIDRKAIPRNKEALRRKIMASSRQKASSPSIFVRKYHSEQRTKPEIVSDRKYSKSKQSVKVSTFQTECRELSVKQSNTINWRIGLRKFREVYASEWETYVSLLQPLQDELQQLKLRNNRVEIGQKKQWIAAHFNSIYKQVLCRNQPLFRQFCPERKASRGSESPSKTGQRVSK